MKRIGLIGGVSPESTVVYYRLLNKAARRAYGGDHSAVVVIYSLDFGRAHEFYDAGDWRGFKAMAVDAGERLERAGCECIAITSNTVQMAADEVAAAVNIPLIRLMDALSAALRHADARAPLFLGTGVTMEGDFYRPTLARRYGVETRVPSDDDRQTIISVIFDELVEGVVSERSRDRCLAVIDRGTASGADSVILGCTELGMILNQGHVAAPLFDTTLLHAAAIADFAFKDAHRSGGAA